MPHRRKRSRKGAPTKSQLRQMKLMARRPAPRPLGHDEFREILASAGRDRDKRAYRLLAGPMRLSDRDRRQCRALAAHLLRISPDMLHEDYVPSLRKIFPEQWLRPIGDWRPKSRGARAQIRSLALHLLADFPVPRFVLDSFLFREPTYHSVFNGAELFRALAAGHSFRDFLEQQPRHLEYTRRMRHIFLTTPVDFDIDTAYWRAFILGSGGGRDLVQLLARIGVEYVFQPDRYSEILRWLCRQPFRGFLETERLLDYLDSRRRDDRPVRLKGRTLHSLTRDVERWNRQYRSLGPLGDCTLPLSGFESDTRIVHREHSDGSASVETWTMVELETTRDLAREGRNMRHCVAGYAEDVLDGESSIWSLRRDGRRRVTVEVDLEKGKIEQIAGKAGREPSEWERCLITLWAGENGLMGLRKT